ncbi:hypothetical protein ACYSNU_15750 [Enterococcus sp. LJL120]
MKKETFNTPFSRYFPRKVVRHLLSKVDAVLSANDSAISEEEHELLVNFKNDLLNKKLYYERASLNFARTAYPLVLKRAVSEPTQQLYLEVLRLNPKLVNGFLGYELLFKNIFGVR